MAKMNVWKRVFPEARTHEGAVAQRVSTKLELRRTVLTCLLWEDTFYEKGSGIAERIAKLVRENKAEDVAALAHEARLKMQLRHVPLFPVRELARRKGTGSLVAATLEEVIQRADEPGEFLAMYWKDKKQPLSAGVKRGLARAFVKFDAYQLAKYDRDGAVKLRDVLFLCHAKPKDEAQAEVWKKLAAGELESPDTWEVSLVVDVSGSMNYTLAKKERDYADGRGRRAGNSAAREGGRVRDCDLFGHLRGAAGSARVRAARCDCELAGAQWDVPEAGA